MNNGMIINKPQASQMELFRKKVSFRQARVKLDFQWPTVILK
jgi:hypothetical protein